MSWVAVASTSLSLYAGYETAKQSEDLSEDNREASVVAQTYDNRQLNERQRQQEEVTSDQKLEARIKALRAESTMQAAGRNISGVSVDRQRQDVRDSLGNVISQLNSNTANQRQQLKADKISTTSTAQSRINSVPKKSYNPLMDLAQGGLSIYGGFQGAKRQAKGNDLPAPSFTDYAFGDWK